MSFGWTEWLLFAGTVALAGLKLAGQVDASWVAVSVPALLAVVSSRSG
jgi:hypothetical protein